MRTASSRIWFTIANYQQTDHPAPNQQSPTRKEHFLDKSQAGGCKPPEFYCRSNPNHPQIGSAFRKTLVDGYSGLIIDRVRAGWTCHLVTFVFTQMAGPRGIVLHRMTDEVQRVYSTLVTRVHRKPRTASTDELPVLVGAADLPVYKSNRSMGPAVRCNGGLHFHVILLMPPASRLKGSVADHFQFNRDLYEGKLIQRIDIRPVVDGHRKVVDYVLKTVLKGRISYDDAVLVLPRTRQEVETASDQNASRWPRK